MGGEEAIEVKRRRRTRTRKGKRRRIVKTWTIATKTRQGRDRVGVSETEMGRKKEYANEGGEYRQRG